MFRDIGAITQKNNLFVGENEELMNKNTMAPEFIFNSLINTSESHLMSDNRNLDVFKMGLIFLSIDLENE